jgi:hypothetical protein
MKIDKVVCASALALAISGCASAENIRFEAIANQNSIVRDGKPALVSRQKNSLVLVSPAARQMTAGSRPVFVVAINNLTAQPLEFRVAGVSVTQDLNGRQLSLPVVPYEQLVSEERTRQVVHAVLVGVAAGANSYSAARAGYGSGYGTVNATTYGPGGVYQTTGMVQTSSYDPTAAAIAQANANAQNETMIAQTIERGQANMAALERSVIKDNTLMPGEWYGGQLHFAPPQQTSDEKTYRISIQVGSDVHDITVAQSPAR